MTQTLFTHFIFWFSFVISPCFAGFDVTVVGWVSHADGLARISVGVIDLLKDDLKINCIPAQMNLKDVDKKVQDIILNPDKTPGSVCFFSSALWYAYAPFNPATIPNSPIKIAYSMLESTSIPPEWATILNAHFDAVVVPDHFLVDVYKSSGVTIPIFELPLGMYLDDYFKRPRKERPSSPFVFGTTVSCDGRKNIPMLIQSFNEVFGGSKDVLLKMNCRSGDVQLCQNLIRALGVSNIKMTHSVLGKEDYLNFIDSFDCFINISKGEGFSLCPREALALGLPCIVTNNSSQITICDSGLVRAVPSTILEPTNYWGLFGGQQVGSFANCKNEDVKAALKDVYDNYPLYHEKAKSGPKWVAQYAWPSLKDKYLNLVKPWQIRLGNENKVTDTYLMTNSKKLHDKYIKNLMKQNR